MIRTVRGPIECSAAGRILPHEHLIVDATPLFVAPPSHAPQASLEQRISLQTAGDIRMYPYSSADNLLFDNVADATRELVWYGAYGSTIADVTTHGIGTGSPHRKRSLEPLVHLSEATGVHIVAGEDSSFYHCVIVYHYGHWFSGASLCCRSPVCV